MGDSNVNLATLIGSRICHDLISPIGAISNGLELLDMAGGVKGPEMDLIADSAVNAGARIRFFRVAYGAAGDQMMGRGDIVSVLDDLNQGGRTKVQWAPLDPQPRGEVRLAFLALQCLETAMPFGGTVRVIVEAGQWTLTGLADKLTVDETLWCRLDGRVDTTSRITPAQVQFALLPVVAGDLGRTPHMIHESGQITLRF
jgi:histidine phosphotransferase ChpT